jgi:PucR-like helix-turn-helix protein/diguanylate cyclase with GGDEF domain
VRIAGYAFLPVPDATTQPGVEDERQVTAEVGTSAPAGGFSPGTPARHNCSMERGGSDAATASLLDGLVAQRATIGKELLHALRDDLGAAHGGDEPLERVVQHCLEHLDVFVAAARAGRAPTAGELAFVRRKAVASAREGGELDVLLRRCRIGGAVLARWIASGSDGTPASASATLALTQALIDYGERASTALSDAYRAERQRLKAGLAALERELLDDLLAGRRGARVTVCARQFGLEVDGAYQVALVVSDDLGRAAATVARRFGATGARGLAVVRDEELVVVGRARNPVRQVLEAAAQDHLLTAGIGPTVDGLYGIAQGYRDARHVLDLAPAGQVVALGDLRLFDTVVAEVSEATHRLVPPAVAGLTDVQRQTLMAFIDCDMDVRQTALALFVHRNTVHYRLRQIERLTGRDVRRFSDLLELVIGVRLLEQRR